MWSYDTYLCQNKSYCPSWYIVRKEKTTLLTSLGNITYHKTLFRNKETEVYEYLLDRIMGILSHTRDAVQTSYQKGGKQVSISMEEVSRETVG